MNKKLFYILIILMFALSSCSSSESAITDETNEYVVDEKDYDDFKAIYGYDNYEPIPIDIKEEGIYVEDKLIYENMNDAKVDGFEIVKVVGKDFLLLKVGHKNNDDIKLFNVSLSERALNAIKKVERTPWSDRGLIDNIIFDIINEAGFYTVSVASEENMKVLDEKLLMELCKNNYDGVWINVGGVTDIDKEELLNIRKDLLKELKLEKDNKYSRFVVKNDNGRSEYRNYFNNGGYTKVSGFVVQNKNCIEYMNSLRHDEYDDYIGIEKEVFKMNNKGVRILEEGNFPMAIYEKGTFLPSGMPAWVSRENAEVASDVFGNTWYADCGKTFDDFKIYCGNTLTAFRGWKDEINEEPDKPYYDAFLTINKWNDADFVDEEVIYHKTRNDDPRYYREKLMEALDTEKEKFEEQVAERYDKLDEKRQKINERLRK